MTRSSIERHARRLARLEKNVRDAAIKPRLGYSSIDDGAMEIRDPATGMTTGIIGQQFDGTSTVAAVGGTFPVAPTMPLVTPIVGGLRLYWDGTYVDGSPTRMDFRRVTFHAVTDTDLIDALDPAQIVGEITIATGGEITISLPYVEHFIYAVVWTEAGKFSVESDIAFGTPLKSSPADQISDGLEPEAPVDWATTLRPLGIMALQAEWPQIENSDSVTYDVYVSDTDGFSTFDATTLAGSTAGSFMAIQSLPGGAAFLPNVTYYARVIARDADGESTPSDQGSTEVRQADSDAISPSYVYTGGIEANRILTGELQASISVIGELVTSAAGRRVSLSSAGIKAVNPSDDIVASIPTNLSEDISFQANIVATSITALGQIAMRSAANEIAQSAALIMRSSTSAPVSAPTTSITYNTLVVETAHPSWGRGGSYYAAALRTYQVWDESGTLNAGVWVFDNTGAHVPAEEFALVKASATDNVLDILRIGSGFYVLTFSDATDSLITNLYDVTTKAKNATTTTIVAGPSNLRSAGWNVANFAYDGTTVWITYVDLLGALRTKKYTGLTGTNHPTGATALLIDASGWNSGIGGVTVATLADVGTSTMFVVHGGTVMVRAFQTLTGTPAETPNYSFPLNGGGSSVKMIAYNSTLGYLVTYNVVTGERTIYDGQSWTTESATWYVTGTWRDADATGGTHETNQGPTASFTMKKRARLSVTMPPIPDNGGTDDPDSVSVYVGRVDGTRTTQFLQATPAVGVRTVTMTAVTFSGTNPPAASNFPAGSPATISSADSDVDGALFRVGGDGGGRWKKYDDLNIITQLAASADLNVTSTHQTPTNLTTTLTSPGAAATWVFDVNLDVERLTTTGNQFLFATLSVDGTEKSSPQLLYMVPAASVGRAAISKRYIVTGLAAGSKIVKVNVWTSSGTDWRVYAAHSTMTFQRVN